VREIEIVPVITIYEVFKVVLREASEADSIIFATAIAYECTVWTQDSDFENLPGVNFFPKLGAGK
jgi:predicted nucleic acid-binding protein